MVQIISKNNCGIYLSIDDVIKNYSNKINKIVYKVLKVVPYEEKDDLISVANIGLIESYNRFSYERECCFWTYAKPRVIGAIKDYLRKKDPLSRLQRKNIKIINKTISELIIKNGEYPNDLEISEFSGMTINKVKQIKLILNSIRFISYEIYSEKENGNGISKLPYDSKNNPERIIEKKEKLSIISALINKLPLKEAKLMNMIYCDGFSLKQIANELELSEGRISQVKKSILKKLKEEVAANYSF